MANPTRSQMKETLRRLKEKGKTKEVKILEKQIEKFNKNKLPPVVKEEMETTKAIKNLGVEKFMNQLGRTKQDDGSYKKTVNKKDGGSICGRPTGKGFGKARRRS